MSLDWNLSNIENFADVCYIGDGDERQMNPVTNSLIWMTIPLGMNEITQQNYLEFYRRLHFWDKVFGSPLSNSEGPYFISLDEVRAHVGLRTNASPLTNAKFRKNVWDSFTREIKERS